MALFNGAIGNLGMKVVQIAFVTNTASKSIEVTAFLMSLRPSRLSLGPAGDSMLLGSVGISKLLALSFIKFFIALSTSEITGSWFNSGSSSEYFSEISETDLELMKSKLKINNTNAANLIMSKLHKKSLILANL